MIGSSRLRWLLLHCFWLGIAIMLMVSPAVGQSWFPLPEFSDHPIPSAEFPPAADEASEYIDLGIMTGGLILATLFALVLRWRKGLFLLAVGSVAWLGFVREGCICPIGSIQNVALALSDPAYHIPWVVVALFTLPLVFTLFFGRTFCSGVCPLGAMQELVTLFPVRVPRWLEHSLGLLAYVYLGAAVILAIAGSLDEPIFVICRYDPFVGLFRMTATRTMLLVGAGFLLVGMFVGRPYCRFLCPYGALLGMLSKLSKWRVKIPPTDCIQCKLCEDACPYGAIVEPTVDQSPADRRHGRNRLAALLILLPILLGIGAWTGSQLKVPLSKLHPTVQLAERVRLEETGQVEGTTEASEAFADSGRSVTELYEAALDKRASFGLTGSLLGAWIGLVIGVKLIHLAIRRRRVDWEADQGGCVACGRCFWYCPNEQARQGLITDIERGASTSETATNKEQTP